VREALSAGGGIMVTASCWEVAEVRGAIVCVTFAERGTREASGELVGEEDGVTIPFPEGLSRA